MPDKDFTVYNMPGMMGRAVGFLQDSGEIVRDETWYSSVRTIYFFLFKFFQENRLLLGANVVCELADTDKVVLRFGDFTPEGQAFVMSQAPSRWEASFDRAGSKKKPSDVSYLEKQLKKMRTAS